jgi:hypothetical protein
MPQIMFLILMQPELKVGYAARLFYGDASLLTRNLQVV